MTERHSTGAENKMGRRGFLRTACAAGLGVIVGHVASKVYLRTEAGKDVIWRTLEEDFGKDSNIEVDEKSQEILNLYNQTIERSLEKLNPIEKAVAIELERRRNIVFAAAEEGWLQLRIELGEEGDGSATTNFSHYPTIERASIDITLPNMQFGNIEMIKHMSHELGHAFRYIDTMNEFGFGSKEAREYMEKLNSNPEYEMDAWIFDNLAAYLYSKIHPDDIKYSFVLDPQQSGLDEIGFTGYWLSRKDEIPRKVTDDLEYKWFLERYAVLFDVALDTWKGEDGGPPVFSPTIRDSDLSEEFITEAKKFFIPTSWSENIGLEMDPTEDNPHIYRYFMHEGK